MWIKVLCDDSFWIALGSTGYWNGRDLVSEGGGLSFPKKSQIEVIRRNVSSNQQWYSMIQWCNILQDIPRYCNRIYLHILYMCATRYYKILQDIARYCILQATARYCQIHYKMILDHRVSVLIGNSCVSRVLIAQQSRTVAAAIVPLVRVLNWRKPKRWGATGEDGLMERSLLANFWMIWALYGIVASALPLVDGYVGDSSVEEATGIHHCATHKGSGGSSWCKQNIYIGNWKVRCFFAQSPNPSWHWSPRRIEVMDRLKIFQITLLCRIPCRTLSLLKPGTWHLSINC